jgi:mannan endo-1,4-beta-mannosidase
MSLSYSLVRTALAVLTTCGLLLGCDQQSSSSSTPPPIAEQRYAHKLSDKNASAETLALYNNLAALRGRHMLFGHEDSLAYGVNWEGDLDRSDVRDVTGSNPAVYGWELGGLELGHEKNLDGVNFKQMQEWIKAGYSRGGVITISWHMYSPVSGANSWDKTPTVHELVPGTTFHAFKCSRVVIGRQ